MKQPTKTTRKISKLSFWDSLFGRTKKKSVTKAYPVRESKNSWKYNLPSFIRSLDLNGVVNALNEGATLSIWDYREAYHSFTSLVERGTTAPFRRVETVALMDLLLSKKLLRKLSSEDKENPALFDMVKNYPKYRRQMSQGFAYQAISSVQPYNYFSPLYRARRFQK